MAPKKNTKARPAETVAAAAAPVGNHPVASDEGPILNLKALNTHLLNEIKNLRSELTSSVACSDTELRRAREQLEVVQAAASEAMEKLVKEVDEKNVKMTEVAGLKMQLQVSNKWKDDILLKCNKLKLESSVMEVENEEIKKELKIQEDMIMDLNQKLELIQSPENRWRTWAWLLPVTTVIVAAGTLAYAVR